MGLSVSNWGTSQYKFGMAANQNKKKIGIYKKRENDRRVYITELLLCQSKIEVVLNCQIVK